MSDAAFSAKSEGVGRFDVGEVRIAKAALRDRIQKNRDGHRAEYEAARDAYRERLIEWFDEQRESAIAGREFAAAFSHPKPKDHTADYDAVLDMLDMSVDEEIVLDTEQFRNYVRDEWGWQQETKALYSSYTKKEI